MGTNKEVRHQAVHQVGMMFRVVIPEQIREALNMVPGTPVMIYLIGDEIVIKRIPKGTVLAPPLDEQYQDRLINMYHNVQSGQMSLEDFVKAIG